MRVQNDVLYFGDSGAVLCGEHLGQSAKTTGRDISGQPIMAVTPDVVAEADAMGVPLSCERCGKRPSRLHVAV